VNSASHFPAVLSVINLYKQKVEDYANFPRGTRQDYFSLSPDQKIKFPDSVDIQKLNEVELPEFDAIAGNFPFIQQEDIPNKFLSEKFREEFQSTQRAFVRDENFNLNERSDYYLYCFYNSLKFLKDGGYLAAITSNAWLGKNYGVQFKRFLLDNFSIQYVFRSTAEHWFQNSQVSTIFITLKKSHDNAPTKFVTLNFKLKEFLKEEEKEQHLQLIENLYSEIDNCDSPHNGAWERDGQFAKVFHKKDKSLTVSIVEKTHLIESLSTQENWATNFIAQNPLAIFEKSLVKPFPIILDVGRGTRTGQDKMFILTRRQIEDSRIEEKFLLPMLKSSRALDTILYADEPDTFLFVCREPMETLKSKFPHAYKWVKKWESAKNKTGVLLPKVFEDREPFWYSLSSEEAANIFISINLNRRIFFSYSPKSIYLNQRLITLRAKTNEVELIAALLNSIVSLLIVESNGVSRNLGALDLNADFFKTKMKMLNPALLSATSKKEIIEKFKPLSQRPVKDYREEIASADRRKFDETVLREFGYSTDLLTSLYTMFDDLVSNRVEMKHK